jgi:hypothetical protein
MSDTEAQLDSSFTLISLVPELHAGTGHVLGYHMSAGEAARIAGWHHVALVPHDHGAPALPQGWQPILRPGTLTSGLLDAIRGRRLGRLFDDTARFAESVREGVAFVSDGRSPGALFVERFNGAQLLGVVRASRLLCGEPLGFWLMFRQDLRSTGFVGRLAYRWAVRRMARDWGDRFRLLADSESLAAELERELGLKAHVLPIPHTHESKAAPFAKDPGEVVCWWPGAPRGEKGLASIQRLAGAPAVEGIAPVRLVVSEETPLAQGRGVRVERVPPRLGELDYDRWLATADVILLPYAADRYRHSTSGIFAEAVVGGRLPLVSAGTWMAHELARHDLAELVIDWGDAPYVLRRIDALARDARVRAKLDLMREHFAGYHCESAYADALRGLLRA